MAECTVSKTVDIMSKKWNFLIILSIYKSENCSKRYSAIKHELDITPKMLSKRLKELEEFEIVKRQVDTESIPIKTYYTLTDSGKDIVHIIRQIKTWGLKWLNHHPYCEGRDCKNCSLSPK
ncbi:MAG: winged helix-turn-helix transcriptional regulator [Candidatus Nanoarchaeia archaeon]